MHDEWGITDGFFDVGGSWHPTSDVTRDRLRESMGTPISDHPMWFVIQGDSHHLWDPCHLVLENGDDLGEITWLAPDLPLGYHDLVPVNGGPTTRLVIHPQACLPIPDTWGVSSQIYALWSNRSWGIGDLADLATIAESVVSAGGRAVLVSPLHQPSPSMPQEASPYYPSSRRAWNPLLIGFDDVPPDVLRCSPGELIDRDEVWRAKRAKLEAMYADVAEPPPLPTMVSIWNALCDEHGPQWRQWPEDIRAANREAVLAKLAGNEPLARRAVFHEWCQQLVADQLAAVAATGVSVIGDLAVGFSPGGADAWEYADLLALDMRMGAPPDPFNLDGQEWGLPPFVPWRLRQARYEPFIETIRAALRGVGGLRIDHVMGLFRQFWIPEGMAPATGAYVHFDSDELLAIVCLEATRAGAFVVGEDLGTVAPGVRERLATCGIAGTKVLLFEPDPPSGWPENALATVTTHDLPTIAGVLGGTDGDAEQLSRLREIATGDDVETVIDDVHHALLDSPARLRLLAMDDLCATPDRPNHPGTNTQPNWRRRLPRPVDAVALPHHPVHEDHR